MPVISKQKKDKIQEQIIFHLYNIFPKQVFTSDIAKETARDEEFIKALLIDLQKKDLATCIMKNPQGIKYEKRMRWRISNKAYDVYSKHQTQKNSQASQIQEKIYSSSEPSLDLVERG